MADLKQELLALRQRMNRSWIPFQGRKIRVRPSLAKKLAHGTVPIGAVVGQLYGFLIIVDSDDHFKSNEDWSSVMGVKVIYHRNCSDGFMSAFLLNEAYAGKMTPEFIPAQYGEPLPDVNYDKDETVWIVDFSYPPAMLAELASRVGSIIMLDHHTTAADTFKDLKIPGVMAGFNMTKCGARMVYDYLEQYPDLHPVQQYALLVDYIEDRDLWKWKLEKSREVSAAIDSYPKSFETWRGFDVKALAQEGGAILRYQKQMVERTWVKGRLETLKNGHVINSVNSPLLQSEIGEALSAEFGWGLVWYIDENGDRINSLRSNGSVNVAEIAKLYGGGGHHSAAGFKGQL